MRRAAIASRLILGVVLGFSMGLMAAVASWDDNPTAFAVGLVFALILAAIGLVGGAYLALCDNKRPKSRDFEDDYREEPD
jgi:hypothetical protein